MNSYSTSRIHIKIEQKRAATRKKNKTWHNFTHRTNKTFFTKYFTGLRAAAATFFSLCVLFLAIFQWYEQLSETVPSAMEKQKKNTARMNDKSTQQRMMKNCSSNWVRGGGKWKKVFFFSSHFLSRLPWVLLFCLLMTRSLFPPPPPTHRQSISLRHFPIRKWYYPPQEAANGKDVNDATSRYSMSDGGGRTNNGES